MNGIGLNRPSRDASCPSSRWRSLRNDGQPEAPSGEERPGCDERRDCSPWRQSFPAACEHETDPLRMRLDLHEELAILHEYGGPGRETSRVGWPDSTNASWRMPSNFGSNCHALSSNGSAADCGSIGSHWGSESDK